MGAEKINNRPQGELDLKIPRETPKAPEEKPAERSTDFENMNEEELRTEIERLRVLIQRYRQFAEHTDADELEKIKERVQRALDTKVTHKTQEKWDI